MRSIKEFFSGFKKGFESFSHVIVGIVNFMLLLIIYVVGIGLTSVAAKIKGKKFLDLENKSTQSYYIEKNIGKEEMDNYYKQF